VTELGKFGDEAVDSHSHEMDVDLSVGRVAEGNVLDVVVSKGPKKHLPVSFLA
jgi:hypothetical protein